MLDELNSGCIACILHFNFSSELISFVRMANKIHPGTLAAAAASSVYFTRKQESFTIWMKSLILNSRGCTVYDSAGQIVYRVDNYDCKHSNQVFLMDSVGTVLFTILRKVCIELYVWLLRLARYWFIYTYVFLSCRSSDLSSCGKGTMEWIFCRRRPNLILLST